MSWEHERRAAVCEQCGHEGIVVVSSDDWGRSAMRYEGFDNVGPNATAVGRKRIDARQHTPKCSCGSTRVRTGDVIADI